VKFELDEMFVQFRLSEALKTTPWYGMISAVGTEWVKPAFGRRWMVAF
jgi:hypothetical protein